MLWRPSAGRQNASGAGTSARAAFRSEPCQAPGPYPSSTMRARTRASKPLGIAVLVFVAVLNATSLSSGSSGMLGRLYVARGGGFLAKIAVAGKTQSRVLAGGDGWTVSDVVCTSGPDDPPFEGRHADFSIAIVAAGTFEYRSAAGRGLMTP